MEIGWGWLTAQAGAPRTVKKRATRFGSPSGLGSVVLAGTSATGPARTAAERRGALRIVESFIVGW